MKLRPGAQSVLSSSLALDVVDRANLPASLSDTRPFHEDRPSLLANAPAEAKDMKSPPITADPSKALLAPTWCRRSFARVRARLRNRRRAGLSLCGNHAALNWSSSSFRAIGRNTTFGKDVATVASLVRLMPRPIATRYIKVSRPTLSFCMQPRLGSEPSGEPVAECAVILGLTYNQMFFAKIRPFDLLSFA